MAKPKYDYKSKEFLRMISELAMKGLTDKEIAYSIGLVPQTFSDKKSQISELSEALAQARAHINSIVRQKYLAVGLGGIKTKTTVRKKLEINGEITYGDIIQETEIELPPNITALHTWLFNHDEEWRKKVIEGKKLDVTSNGKDVSLSFNATPLSEKDLQEIKNIQHGSKENSTDTGLSEA